VGRAFLFVCGAVLFFSEYFKVAGEFSISPESLLLSPPLVSELLVAMRDLTACEREGFGWVKRHCSFKVKNFGYIADMIFAFSENRRQ